MKSYINELMRVARVLTAADVSSIKVIPIEWGTFEARQDGADKILLSPKFFALPSDAVRLHVLLHEVGHWYRFHNVSLTEITGWEPGEKFNDLFSAGNSEEGFAESFAVYVGSPNELKSRYPVQYEQMKEYVGDAGRYKSWAKKKLAEVLKEHS